MRFSMGFSAIRFPHCLTAIVMVAAACEVPFCSRAAGAPPKITNGDFEQWNGKSPAGWTVEVGARNGANEPESVVRKIPGPALMIQGDASTRAWNSVSQKLDVKSGETYRLTFEGRSKGVKREGRQFNNCYVGWMSLGADGKVVGRSLEDLSAETADWTSYELDYTIPSEAMTTMVTVFLSKTGMIGVKGFELGVAEGGASLIKNGSLNEWKGGRPVSWKVDVGANNGGQRPLSKVNKLEGGGVELSGDARTLAWQSVSQSLAVAPGKRYKLQFEAMAQGVRRQGRQYDNCYVGVMIFDAAGKRLDMAVQDLSNLRNWKTQQLSFSPPAGAAKTELLIFLSKSGTLKVKNVQVAEVASDRPFQ